MIVRSTVAKKRCCDIDKVTVTLGWWGSFVKRHPPLTLRSSSKLAYQWAISATAEVINDYFDLLDETLKSNHLHESQMLIYNCDESVFTLQHRPTRVIGLRGQKDLCSITRGDKSQITVLSACSAAGYLLPPMIIFDRKKLKTSLTICEIPGTSYGLSKKGF